MARLDLIPCPEALTLPGLFLRRIERTPGDVAYRQYAADKNQWQDYTWAQAGALAARWRAALRREGLPAGERVAVWLPNCLEWVCFDQAAQSLGLVVVPLYLTDNPDNLAFLLADSGARLLLLGSLQQWRALEPRREQFPILSTVLCLEGDQGQAGPARATFTLKAVAGWLPGEAGPFTVDPDLDPGGLATLVYTSGTTGRPKGVMLSHRNILWNAEAVLQAVPGYREDQFLSFLPLSHTFERTIGYYVPVMAGSCVAFARSLQALPEDLQSIRPTVLVAVPRVFERVHGQVLRQLEKKGRLARALFRRTVELGWRRFLAAQGRGPAPGWAARLAWAVLRRLVADKVLRRLGGRLRLAVSGGAPLFPKIAHDLIGLGLPLVQGYGLTETAPVLTANRLGDNVPDSAGEALAGVALKLGEDGELLVKSPGVMLGYWNRPEATHAAIDAEDWLHTGDQARLADGHVYILGRIKEILVLSNGEKVPPADLEMAICQDPLFDMAMVVGEGRPCLAALVVLNRAAWEEFAAALALDPDAPSSLEASPVKGAVLKRIRERLRGFPGHARPHGVWLTLEPWTVDNGLVTPTLKLKRKEAEQRFAGPISGLYARYETAARP